MGRGLLLGVALSCLTSTSLAVVDTSPADRPTLAVQLGYQGVVRAAEWMPVDIQVQAAGQAVDATLEVQVQDSSEGYLERQNFTSSPSPFGPTYTTVYALRAKVGPGSSEQLRTYVLTDVQNPTVSVRLVSAGQIVSGPTTATAHTTRLLVGVLSNQPSAFNALETLQLPGNLTPRVVPLSVDSLPPTAVLLRAFDLIVIDNFAASALTPDQRTALVDYVNAGGSLMLGTGDSSASTVGFPTSIVPMEIEGTTTLPRVAALPGVTGLRVATGSLRGGNTWLAEGNHPLLVEWPVGSGLITVATFSFATGPMASWSGRSSLMRQVAIRSVLRGAESNLAPTSVAPGQSPITGPRGFQGSVTKRSWFLMPGLGRSSPGPPQPIRLVGLFLVGYAALAGALIFLLVRRAGRSPWRWFIVPVVGLVPVAAFWYTSTREAGPTVAVNQQSITYVAQGSKTAYRETFTAVRPGQTGNLQLSLSMPETIAPFAVGYGPDDNIGVGVRVDRSTPSLDLLRVSRDSVRGFVTERTVTAPGLSSQLSLANGRLKGSVKNASSTPFTDAVVLAGNSITHLGNLPPGASVPIDAPLTTTTAAFGGNLTSWQIYPSDDRISLLQLVLGEYDSPSAQLAPMLLAWMPGVAEPIAIGGKSPGLTTQNAIVMPLTISQVSAGPLPAAFFAPRLVDATGHVDLSQYGAAVDQGSLTYEFNLPLAVGSHVTSAASPFTRPANVCSAFRASSRS